MKKKIKLFAYCHRHSKELTHLTEERDMSATYDRAPEWDVEKEIEVPDEPRKPREWWINYEESFVGTQNYGDDNVHVIEKLPDHVMVSKQKLKDIFYIHGVSLLFLETLCKELGLGE